MLQVVLALACYGALSPAHAKEVAGISYQTQSLVKGTALLLNGAGVRQGASSSVYTAGLYLEHKTLAADEVMQSKGAKQIRIVMLREVSGREFGDMLAKGLTRNTSDDDLFALIPEIMGLGTLIAERGKLLPGDSVVIDWNAVNGTSIRVSQRSNSSPVIEVFAKPALISALMRIWLGPDPADAKLKDALLGKPVL